jgi:16S rRNA (uracil1498-N3)-methyltransferase
MNRIYQKMVLTVGTTCMLDKMASKHLLKVLRMRVGEQFVIFNGEGGEYGAEIISTAASVAHIQILEFFDVSREPEVKVHLGQCLSRGERMDYAIQKAVEVGVAQITPLFSERCNVKLNDERIEKRITHWQKVILSACEQSGRTEIPTICRPMELRDWVKQCKGIGFICDFQKEGEIEYTFDHANILIGPEGGLDDSEISFAHQHNFQSLSLGSLTLRTETAPVVALTRLLIK